MEQVVLDRILFPVRVVSWFLSLPIRFTTWVIDVIRVKLYDPEEIICPGCKFSGDSGTGGKSCSIRCVEVAEPHRKMIEHTCFRCGAKSYSATFRPAKEWVGEKSSLDQKRDLLSRSTL